MTDTMSPVSTTMNPTTTSSHPARAATLAIATLAAALSGCVDTNSRTVLGENQEIASFEPWKGLPAEYPVDGVSVLGVDRANWAPSVFMVPVDGTYHRPTYADGLFLTNVTRRQRGEYPTLESAMDMDGSEFGDTADCQRFEEGFLVPLRALAEGIAIPVRLIGEPQTWEYVSPRHNYERWPKTRSIFLPPPPARPERSEAPAADPTPPGSLPPPANPEAPPGERADPAPTDKPADKKDTP